jgi:hypothetical protein
MAARRRGGRALVVVGGLAAGLSCGGSDPVNPCPTGDCTLPGKTVVKWTFDSYPQWGFLSDTCIDMGASTVHVDMVNTADPTITDASDSPCGNGQAVFSGLPAGMYNVSITPLDGDGNSIVKMPTPGGPVAAGMSGADTMVSVNVPYQAWSNSYTGTYFFRLTWGGMSCELATPPVAKQVLTMTAGGAAVTALTDTGQKLDGTDPEPCRPLSEATAQFVEALPFGPATLLVVGKDSGGSVAFHRRFDTFVGATRNNPTIMLDVATDAPTDSPPDVPPDSPPDAPPDAPHD